MRKDKYLIYDWKCKSFGNENSYVFKTSEMSMRIAVLMVGKIQVCGRDYLLTEEPAFFDGMHSRVKYFVSLTLWVFHPGMHCMVILAIMDALKEDTNNIEIFFDVFCKSLQNYVGEPGYIWDPHYIMMDEKGANLQAIEQIFGLEFWQAKTKTCQWHFIHCAKWYLAKAPNSEWKKFRKWCRKLCDAHTQSEYENVSEKIKIFCKEYEFEGWWKWWSPRCPHIVPALRGFNIPKMNMAETGQSKLKNPKRYGCLQLLWQMLLN